MEDFLGAGRSTLIVHHEQVPPSTGPLSQMVEAPSQAVAGILEFLEVPLDRRRLACLPYIDCSLTRRRTLRPPRTPYRHQVAQQVGGGGGEVEVRWR